MSKNMKTKRYQVYVCKKALRKKKWANRSIAAGENKASMRQRDERELYWQDIYQCSRSSGGNASGLEGDHRAKRIDHGSMITCSLLCSSGIHTRYRVQPKVNIPVHLDTNEINTCKNKRN